MTSVVTIVGNLTSEPEMRHTPNGAGVCNFSLASNRRWMNKRSNEWEEETSFYRVQAWGDLGQNVADCLPKGARVVVSGRLRQRSWESEDGSKHSVVEVVADEIGASLRWATVDIHKQAKGGGGSRPAQARGDDSWNPDEEPFLVRRPVRGDAPWL